jgi:hypothetical protein
MQKSTFDAVDHGWVQPGLVCCPPQCNGLVRDPPEPYADFRQARRKFGMELARVPAHRRAGAVRAPYSWSKVFGWRTPVASAGISL